MKGNKGVNIGKITMGIMLVSLEGNIGDMLVEIWGKHK